MDDKPRLLIPALFSDTVLPSKGREAVESHFGCRRCLISKVKTEGPSGSVPRPPAHVWPFKVGSRGQKGMRLEEDGKGGRGGQEDGEGRAARDVCGSYSSVIFLGVLFWQSGTLSSLAARES